MRRAGRYAAVAVMILGLAACTRNQPAEETAPAADAPAAAPGAPPADAADAEDARTRKTTIWMARNDGTTAGHSDENVKAVCMGAVTIDRLRRVERGRKVRWTIKDDEDDSGCPNLANEDVELRFDRAIWVDQSETNDNTPTLPPVSVLKHQSGNRIEGRVHRGKNVAPDNVVAKYVVYYKGLQASPDPELDILNDCTTCGPGGQ